MVLDPSVVKSGAVATLISPDVVLGVLPTILTTAQTVASKERSFGLTASRICADATQASVLVP